MNENTLKRNKPSHYDRLISIWVSDELLKKARMLKKEWPELYDSMSQVFRSGVNRLYRERVTEKYKPEPYNEGEIKTKLRG